AHAEPIHSLAFHGESRLLASASNDRTARVWDVISGKEAYSLRHANLGFCGVAFSPDGSYLATATWGTGEYNATGFATLTRTSGVTPGEIRVWHASSGAAARVLNGHRGAIWGVAYDSKGRIIATAGEDKTIV